jgi:hypothetical protein
MRRIIMALTLTAAMLFASGCIITPNDDKDDDQTESTDTENETEDETEDTEATEEPQKTTSPEPTETLDPNAPPPVTVNGITVTYDYVERTYVNPDNVTLVTAHFIYATVTVEGNPAASSAINSTLDAMRTADDTTYVEYCSSAIDSYDPNFFNPFELDFASSAVCITEDLLSILVTQYTYSGGAHGSTSYIAFTFDTMTGQELTYDNISTNAADFKTFLQNTIVSQINAMPADSISMFFEDYATSVGGNFPYTTWYTDGVDFVIIYSEYSIAPYAAGSPTFAIPIALCLPSMNAYGAGLFD